MNDLNVVYVIEVTHFFIALKFWVKMWHLTLLWYWCSSGPFNNWYHSLSLA